MTVFKEQVAAVLDRRAAYKEAMAYYEGDVPETFATARLRRAFRTTQDRSRLNFCRPIVNAVTNRLEIANIAGDTKAATEAIKKVWQNNDLGLEAKEIHKMAGVYGDCYVMAWPDADGEIQVSYNSPENMVLVYDEENPRRKAYAVKLWRSGENEHRMNIYTATEIRKYRTNQGEISEGAQWNHVETLDNPFGQIPVFHFRTTRPHGRPEHYDAYDSQNAINKLFVTNMFTIDYQGAPQRYALSQVGDAEVDDFNENDTVRENMGALKNGPGELWYLKGVTQVGEFKPADAESFWRPIKEIVRSMAALTDTPLHYFEKTGNNPTGNGLRTAEAPLLKKVADRQDSYGYTWRDLFRFILAIEGIKSEVYVAWETHESLDEMERWDVSLKKINAGLSHRQALREGGYTDDEIERIMAEREQEAAAGLYYQRAPQTRVNVSEDETTPKEVQE